MIDADNVRRAKRIMAKGATLEFAASVIEADDADLDLALWNALGEKMRVKSRRRSPESLIRSRDLLVARWSDPVFADAARAATRAKARTFHKLEGLGLKGAEIGEAIYLIRSKRVRLADAARLVLSGRRGRAA